MPVVNVDDLIFERFELTNSDFNAGRDDSTSINAGEVAEIATAEVGEDGQLSNYDAVQVGQPASNQGDTTGNEPYLDLQNSTPAASPDTLQWKVAVRRKGELSAGANGDITGFRTNRGMSTADPRQRPVKLGPQRRIAKDGRVLQFLSKDETGSHEVSLGDSTWQIPALGGQ